MFLAHAHDSSRHPDRYRHRRDRRPIGVGRSKTIRTRAMFREWELKFVTVFDPDRLNHGQIVQSMKYAGRYKGLGDHRPRFGRFELLNGA